MNNLVIDLGRGLLTACILFILIWGLLIIAWIASIKDANQRREAELSAQSQAEARAVEQAAKPARQVVPRKVIQVIVLDPNARMAPTGPARRRR